MDKTGECAQTKTFSFNQFGRLRSRETQHFNGLHYELTLIIYEEMKRQVMTIGFDQHYAR